jgi:hypothetical protein
MALFQKTKLQNQALAPLFSCLSEKKAHGHIEKRRHYAYLLNPAFLTEKWQGCQLRTLLVVERDVPAKPKKQA